MCAALRDERFPLVFVAAQQLDSTPAQQAFKLSGTKKMLPHVMSDALS
jgi:hypothetical protein